MCDFAKCSSLFRNCSSTYSKMADEWFADTRLMKNLSTKLLIDGELDPFASTTAVWEGWHS